MLKRLFSTHATDTVKLAFDKWSPRKTPTANPIVFLHGLFGSKSNNRTVSRHFARDLNCDVYCVDMRNHGDSPHSPVHTYDVMSDDVKQFILDHSIKDPVVIGHSMGARSAMALALKNPDLVSKLVVVDNGPVNRSLGAEFPKYVKAMIEVDKAAPPHQKDADEIMKKYVKELPVRQFLLSNFKKHGKHYRSRIPLDILGKSLGYVSEFNYLPDHYRYTKPTLLVRGTESPFVPDEDLPLMGQLFPRFEVRDIKSGHWVISEKPKEFIEVVEKFLDEGE